MLKNYFKTTWRSLWRNKGYSFLNIFGLAIGIACAGLIFLWAEDELNWDSINLNKNKIYAIRENATYAGNTFTNWSTPRPKSASIKTEIPGIANVCRTSDESQNLLFNIGDRSMYASGKYADSSLFSIFTLPFLQGNAATAFKELHSVVITQATAKKFFGDAKKDIFYKQFYGQGYLPKPCRKRQCGHEGNDEIVVKTHHELIDFVTVKDIPTNKSQRSRHCPWAR
jgi:hypothetical protein